VSIQCMTSPVSLLTVCRLLSGFASGSTISFVQNLMLLLRHTRAWFILYLLLRTLITLSTRLVVEINDGWVLERWRRKIFGGLGGLCEL
jgi:hypothetical protein